MKKTIGAVLTSCFIGFLLLGFVFASESARQWMELVWLASLTGLSLLILASAIVFATGLAWLRIKREYKIYPDENGNLPVVRERGEWINLSFVGMRDNLPAWTFWQATNNKSLGTPAREAFATVTRTPQPLALPAPDQVLVTKAGQSNVVDAIAEELP